LFCFANLGKEGGFYFGGDGMIGYAQGKARVILLAKVRIWHNKGKT
jgi:hypothetical protein